MLCLALAISACQDEVLQPALSQYDNEMRFNLTVPGASTKVAGDKFEAEDVIGLYVTDYVNSETPMPLQVSGNRANNMTLTYNGRSWTPAKTLYWGDGKSDVYAYYPYFEDVDDVNSQYFVVAANQEDGGYEASDFMWAKTAGVSKKDGTIELAMKHAMSKLTVKIVAGEDYVGSLPDDASVLIHSTVAAARVDLETGAAVKDPYSGAQSINMKKLGIKKYDGVEAVVYEAVVVPQMLETSVPLLEINSKSVSYLIEDSFNFRPGTAYTYTVTLNTSTNAIRVEIGCELEDWNGTGGDDSGEEGGEGSGDLEEEDNLPYTDLSVEGTANSYIISKAGAYKFKAVQGNLDATVGNVKSVEVLWESFGTAKQPNVGDLVSKVSYKNGYVRFATPKEFKEGNAVIAAKNSVGTILWSWHIWMTDEPQTHRYGAQSGFMMDRNLGATTAEPGTVGSLGLLYQNGRKDPFLGSSSIDESIDAASTGEWKYETDSKENIVDAAESHPMTFYSSHTGRWSLEKSASDPCPVGWRVPRGGEYGVWASAGFVKMPFDYDSMGMEFNIAYPESTWYPATGCRYWENGKLAYVGASGFYSGSSKSGEAASMFFSQNDYNATSDWWYNQVNSYTQSNAFAVRCCREDDEYLAPEEIVPEFSISAAENLSKEGTANSYIVSRPGVYSIAAVKGNSTKQLESAKMASVVWETFGTDEKPTKGDLIYAVKYEDGNVYFKTVDIFKEGNALIAVMDANGTILWSWHIWMTDKPKEQVYYNDAGVMMDRNLGAVSATPGEAGTLGLSYQWGRKDPLMGNLTTDMYDVSESTYLWPAEIWPDSNKGTIEYTISHPTTIFSWGNYGDWLYSETTKLDNTRWQSEKTIYDPCPAGWRIPDGGPEGVFAKALGSTESRHNPNTLNFSGILGDDSVIYYPVLGCDVNNGNYTNCYIWTTTPHHNHAENQGVNTFRIEYHGYDYAYLFTNDYMYRTERYYVRCQKEQ